LGNNPYYPRMRIPHYLKQAIYRVAMRAALRAMPTMPLVMPAMVPAVLPLLIFLVMLLVQPHDAAQAQLSRPGTPPGLSGEVFKTGLRDEPSSLREAPSDLRDAPSGLRDVPFVVMPPVNLARLVAEDQAQDTIQSIPWRFGENIPVNLNPNNSGTLETLDNGDRLWRLGIRSPGAYSLNLTFDRYLLPPGAELYLYNTDASTVLGAFTDLNNQDDLYFATTLVPGEAIIMEYLEPAAAAFPGQLNLSTVTHAYRDPFMHAKAFGSSGPCNLNVACEEAIPWQDQVRATVMLVVGGNGFCSGALVNNVRQDATPYVLSANHCLKDPGTVVFWFNWQSETCADPSNSPAYESMSGAVTRANHFGSDFWLLELNQQVPESHKPFFAGWNRDLSSALNEPITGIHHPRGDIKKFSYALDGVQASSYLGVAGSGTSHWRIVWSGGTTTEPGSSGSAIFDSQGRIIGQLHGGYAACGNTEPDWYGRFGISWTGGGTNPSRLSYWLDPDGTGTAAIGGYDPYAGPMPVPLERTLANTTIPAGLETCFDAQQTITTGGDGPFVVEPGAIVSLVAGERILMLPGTHLLAGSQVHAYITGDKTYCSEGEKHFLSADQPDYLSDSNSNYPAPASDVPPDHGPGRLIEIPLQIPSSDASFRVYPNPTHGTFTLELNAYEPGSWVCGQSLWHSRRKHFK
jgi:hypothetical protein